MADPQAQLKPAQYQQDIPAGWEPTTPIQKTKTAPPPPSADWKDHPPASAQVPPSTIPKHYGFTAGNMYTNAIRGIGELGSAAYNVGNDILNNPDWFTEKNGKLGTGQPGETSMLSKYVTQPALAEKMKAQTAPTGLESVGHSVAEAIPLIGPWVSNLAEQAGTGDIGGAIARGGTQYGTMRAVQAAPSVVKGAVRGGLKAVGGAIADATPKAEPLGLTWRDTSSPQSMQEYSRSAKAGEVPPDVHQANIAKFDQYVARQPEPEITPIENDPSGISERIANLTQRGSPKTAPQLGLKLVDPNAKPAPTGALRPIVTPEEVKSVKQVTPQADEPKPSQPLTDALANKTVREFNEDSLQQGEARRLMRHRVPEELQDALVRDHPEVGQRLIKGTNANFQEMANELGLSKGLKGQQWETSDFARSGKNMSDAKAMVMRELMQRYSPEEILNMTEHWGAPKAKK